MVLSQLVAGSLELHTACASSNAYTFFLYFFPYVKSGRPVMLRDKPIGKDESLFIKREYTANELQAPAGRYISSIDTPHGILTSEPQRGDISNWKAAGF